jgi:hypothetical protein
VLLLVVERPARLAQASSQQVFRERAPSSSQLVLREQVLAQLQEPVVRS